MKFWLILFAVIQSLWSVEAGLLSFRYVADINLFWSFVFCAGISILDFNLYYFLAEKLRQFLIRWSSFNAWQEKAHADNNSWVMRCHRNGYGNLGMFLTAAIPHLLFAGITAQKIIRLKYGYWLMVIGIIVKVAAVACVLKIFEYLI